MGPQLIAVFAAAAAAAAPVPVAPANADAVIVVASPKAGLPQLRAFLAEAGGYAPSLRPDALGRSLSGPLAVELFDAAALEQAGVDTSAPLTLSFTPEGNLVCVASAAAQLVERLEAAVSSSGAPAKLKFKGASLAGATANKAWREGFARKGSNVCVASGAGDVLPALKAAASAMGGGGAATSAAFKSATAGLQGPVVGYARGREGGAGFALTPSQQGLDARVRIASGKPLLDKPRANDPFATFSAPAPVVASSTFSTAALQSATGPVAQAVRFLVSGACRGCDPQLAGNLGEELGRKLSGPAAFVATRLDPTSARIPSAQYFLFPHAWMFGLKDAAGTQALLARTVERLTKAGARAETLSSPANGKHYSVAVGDRRVFVGVVGQVLYVSNEQAARDVALTALQSSTAGQPEKAARVRADGPGLAAALRRITLLDVPKSPELAALFGAGVEFGPLLKAAGPITATGEPDPAGARFDLGFRFQKAAQP